MFILQILAHNAKSYINYMAKYTSDIVLLSHISSVLLELYLYWIALSDSSPVAYLTRVELPNAL
jgi:hypothetical protein